MVPKDKRGFAAVLAVFLAAAAASGLLKGVYLFGWMVHPKSIGIFGQYFRVRGFPFWVLGAAALVLLAFGRKYAAYGITLGNIAGLLAGYVLGERHEAAILAKITPDMEEGTAGAMLCGANDGVFIWLEILLLFFAVGLAMDWRTRRRAGGST